jgi:hypothetical protein
MDLTALTRQLEEARRQAERAERDVVRACKLAYTVTPDCQSAEEAVLALLKLLKEAQRNAWIQAAPRHRGTPRAMQAQHDSLLYGTPEDFRE